MYHKRVLTEVGEDILQENGKTAAYEWVKARTAPIPEDPNYTSGGELTVALRLSLVVALLVAALL